MQRDGNVVLHGAGGVGVFQTRTGGNGAVTLVLQEDRNLVLYRLSDGKALWNSKPGHRF